MDKKSPKTPNRPQESDVLSFRRPRQARGIEKFNKILDAADELIIENGVEEVSLYDVADRANVAVGSVYHFFPSMQSALVALIERYDNNFAELVSQPVDPSEIESWRDVLRYQTERSREYINATPAAMILILGPGQNWGTRLADTAGDSTIASSMIESMNDFYVVPNNPNPNDTMLNCIKILESLWTLSYMKHGIVTDEYAEETRKAMVAYLSLYWPAHMEAKEQE